jgi:hypothetical protein
MKKTGKEKGIAVLLLFIGLVMSACNRNPSGGYPLNITSVKVFPEPIVGEVVTLEVEIVSVDDKVDVKFTIDTLEDTGNKIHLVSGEPTWQGTLTANQPKIFQVKICVMEEGSWPVRLYTALPSSDQEGGYDFEIIQLESTLDSGKLIPSSEYTFSQEEYTNRPTPRPIAVSQECSGSSK